MQITSFVFNPFEVNTYVVTDNTTKECAIIDPGCHNDKENYILTDFISGNNLIPKYILNTHAHIDHILGNKFVNTLYRLRPHFHKQDLFLYISAPQVASLYGIDYSHLDPPYNFIDENTTIKLGDTTLTCLHVPGHSPGSICFYDDNSKTLFSGDVLFKNSIGRTDLPGGDFDTLIDNITKKIFTLNDNVIVYPGHGEKTNIRDEKKYNPFF